MSAWRFDPPTGSPLAEGPDATLSREVQAILSPLRSESIDIDIAPRVMRRIVLSLPRPAPAPLRAPYGSLAWAASLFLGLVALGTLLATALVMLTSGDEGARAAMTLASTAAYQTVRGFGIIGGLLLALSQAAWALGRGFYVLVEAAAPLVRGASMVAAACGLLSIGVSIVLVHRAGRQAPLASRAPWSPLNGGLS